MRPHPCLLAIFVALSPLSSPQAGAVPSSSEAAPSPAVVATPVQHGKTVPADTVDQQKVHAEYGEGNFENVIQILEGYRAGHGQYRRSDSVYIAKYLGVIYVSNPDSREKGKYWLYKMLQMDPGADLVDLYVGEEVEKVFDKVRSEFVVRRNYRGVSDTRLAKAVQEGEPGKKQDTLVLKDTVVVKDNWISPLTEGIKGGYSEVKGGIKAGIEGGYVPIEDKAAKDDAHWTGNINIGGGLKFLDKTQWEDVAGVTDQTEIRVASDLRQRKWPINIALDFSYAFAPVVYQDLGSEGVFKQTIETYEINVGVRKIFDFRLYTVRPFFGGGFGRSTVEWGLVNENYDESIRDGKLGIWVNGGCYWEMDRHFNLGLEYLYSSATMTLFQTKLNLGGHHLDMIAGFHF